MTVDSSVCKEGFLRFITVEKGLAMATVHVYERNLQAFLLYCEERLLSLLAISSADVLQYCTYLGVCGLTGRSIAQHIATLRSFFVWLVRSGIVERNPLQTIRSPKQSAYFPAVLTEEEIAALFAIPDKSTPLGMRDYAFLMLLYATGIRVSELITLPLVHLDLANGLIRVQGKGSKERLVPMYEDCVAVMQQYIHAVRPLFCPVDTVVFVNRSGRKLTRQGIWKLIKQYAVKAGIYKTISPHTLRHTFATQLLKNGADIRTVQMLLGHEDISSTEIYLHMQLQELFVIHQQYHPRATE